MPDVVTPEWFRSWCGSGDSYSIEETSHVTSAVLQIVRTNGQNAGTLLKIARSNWSRVDYGQLRRFIDHEYVESEVQQLLSAFCSTRAVNSVPAPAASEVDVALAQKWMSSQTDYERERCLSARIAERAAIQMYSAWSGRVTDLSALQLVGGNDLWSVADFEADGVLFDVKNSRRSYSSINTYAERVVTKFPEHYVARFKSRDGSDVSICGTVSEYAKWGALMAGAELVLLLGATTMDTVQRLTRYFESDQFSVNVRSTASEWLPPWLFELPTCFYREQRSVAQQLLKPAHQRELTVAQLATVRVSLGEFEPLQGRGSPAWKRFLTPLLELGRSLPVLYLSILTLGLTRDRPAKSRMVDTIGDPLWPFGVYDPLRSVNAVVTILWDIPPEDLSHYSKYHLDSTQILKAWSGSRWETLFAYCGGRFDNGVACGFFPLSIATHTVCETCFRLVCSECGYCSSPCTRSGGARERLTPTE